MVQKKIAPKGSVNVRKCGLVGFGVVLLEEVGAVEAGFEVS